MNCCISNYHKCSGLKQYPMISSYFCRSEVQTGLAGLLLWVSQGYYQVSIRLGPSLGAVGKSWLPSSFVCLLADSSSCRWWLIPCCQPWATLTPGGCLHSFSPISASSRQHYYMESLYIHFESFWLFLLLAARENFSLLKSIPDWVRPTQNNRHSFSQLTWNFN